LKKSFSLVKLLAIKKHVTNSERSQRAFTLIELPVVRKQAFTLIELLVVVAIISILATIVMVSVFGARVKARDAVRMSDIDQVSKSLQLYEIDNSHYPNPVSGDDCWIDLGLTTNCGSGTANFNTIIQPYLSHPPSDPQSGQGREYKLNISSAGKYFLLLAQMENENYANCSSKCFLRYDYPITSNTCSSGLVGSVCN